ncbi:MAG: hypothetical protein JXP73_13380 [Deltaproteobacteria bacterium]|nr:hypothetical protein [Deltaproteobacteria bacterium]
MHHHTPIVLAAISACSVLLGVGCGSGSSTSGTTTSAGGASTQGGTLGAGGQIARGGAGGSAGSVAGGGSGTGGNASGGNAGGTAGTTPSGGSATGASAGGTGGTLAAGGGAGGGGTARGGVTGSGGGNGTGGTGTAGSTSTGTGGATGRGGSTTGGRGGGGAQSGGAGAGGASANREGFYKEIFMDVGVGLDHLKGLPSADKLGWEWEFVSTDDVEVQHAYMWGDANDDNGVLLYPDRDPRFMIIYTGGGYGDHAGPVGATGIENVQDFFANGGSYVGTCNGNYMAWNWAYKLWPGQIKVDSYEGLVDGVIPDDSPLLRYYDFGGDKLISGLSHYSGGYETGTLPAGTEVLLMGKSHSSSTPIDGDGQVTGYAYKPKETSGRVCGINDHPEYANQPGEIMNYLQAAFRYARDGLGTPDVKAALANGEERVMDKASGDDDPAHTKIGDKQYHHFTVSLPEGTTNLDVALSADDAYDMNLYAAKDTFAFASRASQSDTAKGANKTLTVASPGAGTWYIGVECATTVTATKTSTGYTYSGNLAVLNGVKYAIKASWTQ